MAQRGVLVVVLAGAIAATHAQTVEPAGADDVAAIEQQAAEAYERGACDRVLALLEALAPEQQEQLSGISHYRWGYCLGATRRGAPRERYEAAAQQLATAATEPGAALETHFYLVNARLNLGQADEAAAAARRALERWEAGTLTVPQDDPDAWFRLGKLHRDAGDPSGAIEPFRRAVAAARDQPKRLAPAYLERISDAARGAGALDLSTEALALLEAARPSDPRTALRRARDMVAAGQLEAAHDLFERTRREPGEVGMAAQYYAEALDRVREVSRWGLQPAETTREGLPVAEAPLAAALSTVARDAYAALAGPSIEVPRKRREGTRAVPAPTVKAEMERLQAEFAGLLREAIVQGAPLREWAVQGGYAPLIHHPWKRLYQRRLRETRDRQLIREQGGGQRAP